jgi:exosortase
MLARIPPLLRSLPPALVGILLALAGVGLWAYWPTLGTMAHKWMSDPQYSHGYLVPVFAVVLLGLRRSHLAGVQFRINAWGVPLFLVGVLLRLAAAAVAFDWLDAISLLPCLAGACVLVGGWPALRWAWPAIAFLAFMVPLPFRVETALSHPLQAAATKASTYVMQTIGLPALSEGNTIILSKGRIGVVQACSGLSMMLIFFALSTAVGIVINRPWLDRAIIVVSAAPIAVLANVIRITVTGIAQELISPEVAHAIFHDWAGWLMMPLALGLLWCELWLLSRLLVPAPATAAVPGAGQLATVAAPQGGRKQRKVPRAAGTIPPPVRKS